MTIPEVFNKDLINLSMHVVITWILRSPNKYIEFVGPNIETGEDIFPMAYSNPICRQEIT